MTLTKNGDGVDFDRIIKEFDTLNKYQVAVGFFGDQDAKILQIVRANEYGALIRPKTSQYLMVPRKAKGKIIGYYKLKQVVIPARPFIRNAWQDNKDKYKKLIVDGLDAIYRNKTTAMQLLNKLGTVCMNDIQDSARKLKEPPDAPLTVENKGSDNPLVDTGEMIRKVTYKVVKV